MSSHAWARDPFEFRSIGVILDDFKSLAVVEPARLIRIAVTVPSPDRCAEIRDVVLIDHQQRGALLKTRSEVRQKFGPVLLPDVRPPQVSHPRVKPPRSVRQAPRVGLNQCYVFAELSFRCNCQRFGIDIGRRDRLRHRRRNCGPIAGARRHFQYRPSARVRHKPVLQDGKIRTPRLHIRKVRRIRLRASGNNRPSLPGRSRRRCSGRGDTIGRRSRAANVSVASAGVRGGRRRVHAPARGRSCRVAPGRRKSDASQMCHSCQRC